MNEIPIFFTFDNLYVVPAGVAFHSLLQQADAAYVYRLYVLHDALSATSMQRLTEVVERATARYGKRATLEFIDISTFDVQANALKGKSHFSKEIYYKLVAAELFPQYDRILCSDVDVVFTGDIAPSFFLFPGEEFHYAGVGQILESQRQARYVHRFTPEEQQILTHEIAAGYLLLNLKAQRAAGMARRMAQYYKENYQRLCLPEQETMILCCWPDVRPLPMEYVVCNIYYLTPPKQARFYTPNPALPRQREAQEAMYRKALEHPVQLHYVGAQKPWNTWGVPRSEVWFATLKEAGLRITYLKALPSLLRQRLKRYSLKRFIRKRLNALRSRQPHTQQPF